MMKLVAFRVRNFRSVDDSEWIDTCDVTAFIGTNESGKTNLLLPLWKLNPAKGGEINPIQDYPRDRYNNIRVMEEKPVFIEAKFELTEGLDSEIASMTGYPIEQLKYVIVGRDFDGNYCVFFPNVTQIKEINIDSVRDILQKAESDIVAVVPSKTEEILKESVISALNSGIDSLNVAERNVDINIIKNIQSKLTSIDISKAPKRSIIAPRFGQVIDEFEDIYSRLNMPRPEEYEKVYNLVIKSLPVFVYYSNYGNLDSEIYLPHVIQNMKREDLGVKEAAKARTLRVLFDFVKLKPEEILQLGKDIPVVSGKTPTQAEIDAVSEKKKERDILLQSASTELTSKFRDWWKQGDYRFRFQADGDHFRIWVSDDKRPEDIELEGRSTGLQWFLSFYLVFLVESKGSHKDAILLLDEPGLSLHPLAQRDLSAFFENLSNTNQILYTTHSPFMVDPDHLDRVKAVYVESSGSTAVSPNLRASEGQVAQSRSIYPVYAALGLSVSDTLLQGCQAIVVEGSADQHYLSAIKNYLIGKGELSPSKEMIFVPAGGVRGISAVVSILTGKDEALPYAILDGDAQGISLAKKLRDGIYQGTADRVIVVSDVIGMPNSEIEDLFSADFMADVITRLLPRPAGVVEDIRDLIESGKPIVAQIENYASNSGITLQQGWKVELAKLTKMIIQRVKSKLIEDEKVIGVWKELFKKIQM